MLEVRTITVTPFFQHCRVIVDSVTKDAAVVDPGGDVPRIIEVLRAAGATCRSILLTHSHLDHCGGVAALVRETGAEFCAHPGEEALRKQVEEIASSFGFEDGSFETCPDPDRPFTDGAVVRVGSHELRVLHTPGHSPGHLAFYSPEFDFVVSGDSLFNNAVGRTDLDGGDVTQLMNSITSKLLALPSRTRILPGHGSDTTVGAEALLNPVLKYWSSELAP